jgi:hypothetical protein
MLLGSPRICPPCTHRDDPVDDPHGQDTGRCADGQPGDHVLHVVHVRRDPGGGDQHGACRDDRPDHPLVCGDQRGEQAAGGTVVGREAVVGGMREQRRDDGSCTNGRGSTCSLPASQMPTPTRSDPTAA